MESQNTSDIFEIIHLFSYNKLKLLYYELGSQTHPDLVSVTRDGSIYI